MESYSLGGSKKGILCVNTFDQMPSTQCCMPACYNRDGHQFPHDDPKRYSAWVNAPRRVWPKGKSPSKSSVVCYEHTKLHTVSAIPIQFSWNLKPSDTESYRHGQSTEGSKKV